MSSVVCTLSVFNEHVVHLGSNPFVFSISVPTGFSIWPPFTLPHLCYRFLCYHCHKLAPPVGWSCAALNEYFTLIHLVQVPIFMLSKITMRLHIFLIALSCCILEASIKQKGKLFGLDLHLLLKVVFFHVTSFIHTSLLPQHTVIDCPD